MPQSKLYYDDPLAAAYMAREFRVQYESKNGHKLLYATADIFMFEECEEVIQFMGDKYYIHPDSLAVFEPREGDLIKNIKDLEIDGNYEFYDNNKVICTDRIIIQRDNKPVFWPKGGEDE